MSASYTETASSSSDVASVSDTSVSSDSETPMPPKPQPPTSQPPSIKGPPHVGGTPAPSRFFLDAFAGVHAPLRQAAAEAGLDRYEPLDIISKPGP